MQKFFIDTNIIIDLLANREPHSKYATQLFNAAERGSIKLYTSSH
jgi:predicted nucleic acid-binding protein